MDHERHNRVPAWIVLPGHRETEAHVEVRGYSLGARVLRTAALLAGWGTLTATVFFVTIFDPFMTSMPLVIGAVAVWRSWKGRYRVQRFEGSCPRCGEGMTLKPGSKISVPHPLVCYSCHHEPALVLARKDGLPAAA
ncbi:MAG TPA: hypothetical protein VFQ39_10975 [Longimicrobium sp.]|nr:hypothetical protein [Longimicrobium sp.]